MSVRAYRRVKGLTLSLTFDFASKFSRGEASRRDSSAYENKERRGSERLAGARGSMIY